MQVRRSMVRCVIAAASIGAVLFAGQLQHVGCGRPLPRPTSWLTTVNAYRAMSGLAPVTENTTWSAEGHAHSCYMLAQRHLARRGPWQPGLHRRRRHRRQQRQRRRQQQHRRDRPQPHRPLDDRPVPRDRHPAPQAGDERVRHLRRRHRPAHGTPEATLDVLRGIDHADRQPDRRRPCSRAATPRSPSTASVTESPNPLTFCGWSGAAGLPLIAMMPGAVTSANATLVGPVGPVETLRAAR